MVAPPPPPRPCDFAATRACRAGRAVHIGVLTDANGPYAGSGGPESLLGAPRFGATVLDSVLHELGRLG